MITKQQNGFTIVELLIVIVVIAILAAISIVAYNGIQTRATDTKIKAAATDLEKAIRLFAIETGKQPYSGSQSTGPVAANACPGSTVASGFAGRPTYQCTLEDLLVDAGKITASFFASLPPNKAYTNTSRATFMFYQCYPVTNNRYSLYWYLTSPTSEETSNLNDMITTCSNPTQVRDNWGMRAGKIIQL